MNASDAVRLAAESLFTNRRRSLLSLLGVVIGVVAVTSLTAIGEGALRYVDDPVSAATRPRAACRSASAACPTT
jgi:putative ABC transport system permease protein